MVLLQADNRVAVETFEEVLQLAILGCKSVAMFMRGRLLERVQQMGAPRQLMGPGAAVKGEDAEQRDEDM